MADRKFLALEALDTLFFRDGKPFTMGAETWAGGIFPPPPSVLYGALRAIYFTEHPEKLPKFTEHPEKLPKANQAGDETEPLRIRAIYIGLDGKLHLPLPLDYVVPKQSAGGAGCELLTPAPRPASSSPGPSRILQGRGEVQHPADGWMDLASFGKYLEDAGGERPFTRLSDWIIEEPRIGIGRSRDTRTAAEGMLYRTGLVRPSSRAAPGQAPQPVSLVVEYEGLELPDKGLLRLGGEGKAASYSHPSISCCISKPSVPTPAAGEKIRFKVVLASPGIFNAGWLPACIQKAEIVAMALGRPLPLGGFDMAAGKPKAMRRAVPAGSVYYLEVTPDRRETILKVHGTAISDEKSNQNQGFGLAYIGLWHETDGRNNYV